MPDTQDPVAATQVTHPYQNPIHAKMQGYGERLRDLLLEAYADGIVLSTTEPQDGELPLLDNQHVYHLAAMVPLTSHTHLNMKLPEMVRAKAVTIKGEDNMPAEIVPSMKIPTPEPALKPKKVVPVRRAESEWAFVNREFVQPWMAGAIETSAIKFGVKFDLIGISVTEGMGVTDSIAPGIALESIYYRDAALNIERLETIYLPYAAFVVATQGDYRDQSIQIALSQNAEGDWYTAGSDKGDIVIEGKINLQFGTCELTAKSNKPGLIPLGYTLDAYYSNPNRRGG